MTKDRRAYHRLAPLNVTLYEMTFAIYNELEDGGKHCEDIHIALKIRFGVPIYKTFNITELCGSVCNYNLTVGDIR